MAIAIALFACTAVWASQGEAEGTGQNIFGGTFADAVWTIAAFVLLLAVLSKVAWKPLLAKLSAREEYIQHQIESAEDARARAEKMLEDYQQQGLQVIEKSTEQAQRSEHEIEEKTRQELLVMRQRARDDIQHSCAAASDRLWDMAADMVLTLGSEVVGRNITADDNERLIREAIARIRSSQTDTGK